MNMTRLLHPPIGMAVCSDCDGTGKRTRQTRYGRILIFICRTCKGRGSRRI